MKRNSLFLPFVVLCFLSGTIKMNAQALSNDLHVGHYYGQVLEENHYYPFGLTISSTGAGVTEQPLKYQAKELERSFGLEMFDFHARMYDPQLGRSWQPDPMAHIREWTSPYSWVQNNPISRIDPTGAVDDDIYYNETGKEIHRVENDKPDRNYVIKTTQTTTNLYGKDNYPEKGKAAPISKEAAENTEKEISAGNLQGEHMKNVTEVGTTNLMDKMVKIVSKDDGTGGTNAANNKEYGGFINGNIVKEAKSGNAADPSKGQNAAISGDVDFHSHPSGTKKVPQGTAMWAQPPSATDIKTAVGKDYVFGMRSGTIYIYTNRGVIATIPLSVFQKK